LTSRQFPDWFEFNERFLLFLADNVYSCRFGTFLFNSCKERREHDVHNRTVSIWTHVEEHLDLYQNRSYSSVDGVLVPR
jgi:myotubularin-related protein 1/2